MRTRYALLAHYARRLSLPRHSRGHQTSPMTTPTTTTITIMGVGARLMQHHGQSDALEPVREFHMRLYAYMLRMRMPVEYKMQTIFAQLHPVPISVRIVRTLHHSTLTRALCAFYMCAKHKYSHARTQNFAVFMRVWTQSMRNGYAYYIHLVLLQKTEYDRQRGAERIAFLGGSHGSAASSHRRYVCFIYAFLCFGAGPFRF